MLCVRSTAAWAVRRNEARLQRALGRLCQVRAGGTGLLALLCGHDVRCGADPVFPDASELYTEYDHRQHPARHAGGAVEYGADALHHAGRFGEIAAEPGRIAKPPRPDAPAGLERGGRAEPDHHQPRRRKGPSRPAAVQPGRAGCKVGRAGRADRLAGGLCAAGLGGADHHARPDAQHRFPAAEHRQPGARYAGPVHGRRLQGVGQRQRQPCPQRRRLLRRQLL